MKHETYSKYESSNQCVKLNSVYHKQFCCCCSKSDEKREEISYDVEVSVLKIRLWKQHIMRTVHQDTAKKTILDEIKPNQVLIIMDWAMKFLPISYRETQSEWYGKKGRPWHVCAAIIKKPDGEFEV